MTYQIQANPKGSRHIEVTDLHLETIAQYRLLENINGSTGIIDDAVLSKLRLTVRSLLETPSLCPPGKENEEAQDYAGSNPVENGTDGKKELLNLCLDVIYHSDMKTYGLKQLTQLYAEWSKNRE